MLTGKVQSRWLGKKSGGGWLEKETTEEFLNIYGGGTNLFRGAGGGERGKQSNVNVEGVKRVVQIRWSEVTGWRRAVKKMAQPRS